MAYRLQKRKPRNLNRVASGISSAACRRGGAPDECFFPNQGRRCANPGTPGCDARLRTRGDAANMPLFPRMRFYLDKARTFYWSGIAKRKKYGAYKLMPGTQQNQTYANDPRFADGVGVRHTAQIQFMPGTRRDGFSPTGTEPGAVTRAALNREGATPAQRWLLWASTAQGGSGRMGKRYHYQAEALIRNGTGGKPGAAGYLRMAAVNFFQFLAAAVAVGDDEIISFVGSAAQTFNANEIDAMRRWTEASAVHGGAVLDGLNAAGRAEYAYVYEPILRDIHTGKQRRKPLAYEKDQRKAISAMVDILNDMLSAQGYDVAILPGLARGPPARRFLEPPSEEGMEGFAAPPLDPDERRFPLGMMTEEELSRFFGG